MGYLKYMTDRSEEVLAGTYYKVIPQKPTDSGERLASKIVNQTDTNYAKLLDSLEAPIKTMTISTDDRRGFEIKGYIVSQDGDLWQITGLVEAPANDNTMQALRRRVRTIQSRYIMRLIGVENPWEIE
jgi:hypothetical protein